MFINSFSEIGALVTGEKIKFSFPCTKKENGKTESVTIDAFGLKEFSYGATERIARASRNENKDDYTGLSSDRRIIVEGISIGKNGEEPITEHESKEIPAGLAKVILTAYLKALGESNDGPSEKN